MAITLKDFELTGKKIFIFRQKDILVKKDDHSALPNKEIFTLLKEKGALYLNLYDSCTNAVAADIGLHFEEDLVAAGIVDYVLIPLRQFFYEASEEISSLSARMAGYINWLNNTKFCDKCGNPLELHQTENALYCKACGKIHFPRIEPCIIVLVHKNDEILLLRHTYRNQDRFACLAGFMELGESAEECVAREVKEEVGIEITNIRYKGSQGWPFPDQLMLAFYADYKSGEIKLQENEVAEAKWFTRDNLPNVPNPGTVAWKLIHNKF